MLIYPVGHYLGAVPAHRVRVGGRVRPLPAGDPHTLWLLAHGDDSGRQPLTPGHVAAAAPWLTAGRIARAGTELVDRGLLIAVDPDDEGAEAVARSYRWHSMLRGHGMRLEFGGRYGIGAPDGPWLLADNLAHDLWRWAPVTPTLWDACIALAPAYRDPPGDDDPVVTGPEELLPHVWRRLHPLVCSAAGFLDEAA